MALVCFKSLASVKENIRFLDSPDFENFRASGPDMMSSRTLVRDVKKSQGQENGLGIGDV